MSVSGVYLFESDREKLKWLRELYGKQRDDEWGGKAWTMVNVGGRKKRMPIDHSKITDAQVIRIAIDLLYEKEQEPFEEEKRRQKEEHDALYITNEHGFGRKRRSWEIKKPPGYKYSWQK